MRPPSNEIDVSIQQALSHNEADLAVTSNHLQSLEQKMFKEWNLVSKITHTSFRHAQFPCHAATCANMERIEFVNF
jgi:hypothetical protein